MVMMMAPSTVQARISFPGIPLKAEAELFFTRLSDFMSFGERIFGQRSLYLAFGAHQVMFIKVVT